LQAVFSEDTGCKQPVAPGRLHIGGYSDRLLAGVSDRR
jgi:hypothetical protein